MSKTTRTQERDERSNNELISTVILLCFALLLLSAGPHGSATSPGALSLLSLKFLFVGEGLVGNFSRPLDLLSLFQFFIYFPNRIRQSFSIKLILFLVRRDCCVPVRDTYIFSFFFLFSFFVIWVI